MTAGINTAVIACYTEKFDNICSVDCKIAESDREVQREGRLYELQESYEVGSLIQ